MTTPIHYAEEIVRAVNKMPEDLKDQILKEALAILFRPENKLKTPFEEDEDRLVRMEMIIDEYNEVRK